MKEVFYGLMQEGDFDLMELPNEIGLHNHKDFPTWGKIRLDEGNAFTCRNIKGDIICCFGCTVLWHGVGEVWAAFSDLIKDYRRETVIETGIILNMMQQQLQLWRLQADVIAIADESNRFIKHYGFEFEGTMKAYNPYGLDVNRYARVRR